jgi:hypothetical protein
VDGGVPLNDADKKALIVFLKTLTDNAYETDSRVEEAQTLSVSASAR